MVRDERDKLEAARREFVREPQEERLHLVRTTGRRLRSLLEDVADLDARSDLLAGVKLAAEVTDGARDSDIAIGLLESSLDAGERETASARDFLDILHERAEAARAVARRRLRKMRF